MRNKFNYLYLAFFVVILPSIVDLVNARPRASFGKYSYVRRPNHRDVQLRNEGKSNKDNNSKESSENNGDDRYESKSGNGPKAVSADDDAEPQENKKSGFAGDTPDDDDDDEGSENINANQDDDEDENSLNDENNKSQENNDDEQEFVKKLLKAGNILTPHDLLPVTTRIMKKLDIGPGEGKGIVSSSKNAQDMADRIFAAYFATMKRIIILKEEDIPGLDALQALVIEGEPANLRYIEETYTKRPAHKKRRRQQSIRIIQDDRRSLKPKKISRRQKPKESEQDVNLELMSKIKANMPKIRHLVVNGKAGPQTQNVPKNGKLIMRNSTKSENSKTKADGKKTQPYRCTWRYVCKKPDDLDTCDLIAKCMNETFSNNTMKVSTDVTLKKNKTATYQRRRSTGFTQMDEEVEKIIENHNALIKPENPHERSEKIESLDQYFNNIIIAQNEENATPLPQIEEIDSDDSDSKNKESFNNNSEDENADDNKSSNPKSYPAQIDEKSDKERNFRPPPFGLPLRHLAEPPIERLMNSSSNLGFKSGSDVLSSEKSATHNVTPKIVRLITR